MEEIVVQANPRTVIGKQVKALRRAGQLPAVIYGTGMEPTPIVLNLHDASRVLNPLPSSTLIYIELEGARHMALVREKQRDVIRGTLKHVDFQAVSITEKLRVAVPIEAHGESPAVREENGILVMGMESLEVESFPQDLPNRITIDLTQLKAIGDGIYVRDIVPPANVEILEDPDEMVALVTAPAAEEVEEAEAEAATGEEPEVIERGKREEEEEE